MNALPIGVDEPWLVGAARRVPDAPALVIDGAAVTFAALAAETEHLARALIGRGVTRDSRLALLMTPSRRLVALVHAAQRIGAAVVMLGTRLTALEIAEQAARVAPALLVHDAECAPLAAAVAATATRATAAVVVHEPSTLARVLAQELDAGPRSLAPLADEIDPHAALTILFTSGTAARPKAVVSTNASHHASACSVLAHLGVRDTDTWLCTLPLAHVGGLSILFRAAISATTVVLRPSFDAARVDHALRNGAASFVSLVPTMLARLVEIAVADPLPEGALRAAILGGAALDPRLAAAAASAGYRVIATYGLTETASQVCATLLDGNGAAAGSSGRPLAGVELRIELPDREGVGEILVRAPQVMTEYLDDPDATSTALAGGWLHTGDAGRLCDGELHVVDRRADLIVTGGENVAPAQIEAVLGTHPLVLEAGVYGEPDDLWGKIVCAAVVPRPGACVAVEDLAAWCETRLAAYKRPRRIRLVETLPRTASGKLRRVALAAARERR